MALDIVCISFAFIRKLSKSLGHSACEIAVYGSTMAVTRGTDGVEKAGQTSRAKEDTYVVSGNKQEIQVSFDKNLKIPFQNLSWRRKTSVKSKIIRPVLFIEKVQKARKIASGFQ